MGGGARPIRPSAVAVAAWAARFVLVAIGRFRAVGDYSSAAGTGRAHCEASGIAPAPDVAVPSETSLALHVPGVVETPCREAGSADAVRYDGLKLVIRSGDRYVFLPSTWRPGTGVAIVLPRTDALRLEFAAPGAPRTHVC